MQTHGSDTLSIIFGLKPAMASLALSSPMMILAQAVPVSEFKGIMEYGAAVAAAAAFAFFYWQAQSERRETSKMAHAEELEQKKVEIERAKADVAKAEATLKVAEALSRVGLEVDQMKTEVRDLNQKPCMAKRTP